MTIENVLDKYEYSKKDLIGHGAFAVVFKGKSDQVIKYAPYFIFARWYNFEISTDHLFHQKRLDDPR